MSQDRNPGADSDELLPVAVFSNLDNSLVPHQLRAAVHLLLELAQKEPDIDATSNPSYGRFQLASYSQSTTQNRAVLRLLRRSLDFLEADFLACEDKQIDWMEKELAAIRAARRS